ncbi:FecR family protein [Membranihabitans maritimus]|uniref:FecR family protein n=1 Tax=Membranihabitans maritimus TaxID=2904244 RepID=UPI001F1CA7B4|nr:FecR domain-containing protein [Membranihabitans maritimus]
MKEDKDIRNLLEKYVENKCSEEEIEWIVDYFRNQNPSEDFPLVEEVLAMVRDRKRVNEETADRIFREITQYKGRFDVKEEVSKVTFGRMIRKYAAVIGIIFFLGAGYLLYQEIFSPYGENMVLESGQYDIGTTKDDAITLELGDGRIEVINPDGSRMVKDEQGNVIGIQNQEVLTYENGAIEKLQYNTLRVPYGRRFQVRLSDGTLVYLNAGSSLKFPVKFLNSEQYREVIVSGEAYFDVSENKDKPFIVNTGGMDIRVLGTQFNVSTYPEDESIEVVLVEGLVRLDMEANETGSDRENLLKPGYKASFSKEENTVSKQEVATSIYTSWTRGELVFRNMTFEDILKKMERKYDVKISNQNDKLAKERFNASFGDVSIEKVLSYLHTIYGIDFTIQENNSVIIQ